MQMTMHELDSIGLNVDKQLKGGFAGSVEYTAASANQPYHFCLVSMKFTNFGAVALTLKIDFGFCASRICFNGST